MTLLDMTDDSTGVLESNSVDSSVGISGVKNFAITKNTGMARSLL